MVTTLFRRAPGSGSEVLQPLPGSVSGWGKDQLRGMAVSGALARATERTAGQAMPEMRPARWAVDLFRPVRARPTTVVTAVIKKGRRIGLIDAELHQQGQTVARSRALFVVAGDTPEGGVWRPAETPQTPPPGMLPDDGERLYHSEQTGWTARADARNDTRKKIWHFPMVLVEDERLTPFQFAACVADVTSLVVNWGSAGMEHINVDISLVLTRLPHSMELGLSAADRSEHDGISAGTAVLFDRVGPLGSVSTVALANPGVHARPGGAI